MSLLIIRKRLQAAFSPEKLEVIDESHKHKGHAGSQNGAGHYAVTISAECFKNLSRVDAHREVYRVLSDLIPEKVHALSIKIFL